MTTHWHSHYFMSRQQMREYDRIAMAEVGIAGVVLMENAGRAVAEMAARMAGGDRTRHISIVAGPGNNGGDGVVAARHLLNAGYDVTVHLAVNPERIAGDALPNYQVLRRMGACFEDITRITALIDLKDELRQASVVVDALLGTGISRPVEGQFADIIDIMNDAGVPILAVDVPSGLDADRGVPANTAVRAAETVTFGHYKTGLVLHPGSSLAGRCHVVPIGVPGAVSTQAGINGEVLHGEMMRARLPGRPADAHKGTCGHLLLLAGSLGKSGAAVMAGNGALRVGTGLATIATTSLAQPVIESRCTESMVEGVMEKVDAAINDRHMKRLEALLDGKRALVVGPGLTTAPGISNLVMRLLQMIAVPAVVDADGLNMLAADPTAAGRITAPLVLTPHPGEMARLSGKTVLEVQADRIQAARSLAEWHKAVAALKGARTAIAAPDGRIFINPTGNPGMATAGTGDVLAGMIGGFLAQGLSPLDAAIVGTYLHGVAGDVAALRLSRAAMLAGDLLDEIPVILRDWECQRPPTEPTA